jgi:molybdate transport system permease protein
LAYRQFRAKGLVEALVMLPLVLPPTVFGFYLLVAFGRNSPIGNFWQEISGINWSLPSRGWWWPLSSSTCPLRSSPHNAGSRRSPRSARGGGLLRHVALRSLWKVELPLAWPGIMTAMVLTFAHTLGEFGIVLMVGGSIPGETKTIAIAIYDRVQGFDDRGAGIMSAVLVAISLFTITITFGCRRESGEGCPDGAGGYGEGRSTDPAGCSLSGGAGRVAGIGGSFRFGQDHAFAHNRRAMAARCRAGAGGWGDMAGHRRACRSAAASPAWGWCSKTMRCFRI